jgi:hypothetical protein
MAKRLTLFFKVQMLMTLSFFVVALSAISGMKIGQFDP